MVHPLSGLVQNDEKETKRLNSLEQKMIELENNLLRTSNIRLEKRVAELEASLRESNEECDKLKQTITHINSVNNVNGERKRIEELEASLKESNEECDKLKQTIAHMNIVDSTKKDDVIPSMKEGSIDGLNCDYSDADDSIPTVNKEDEIVYGRILKLIENMKSDCQKAINMKIPTESQLPKAPGSKLSSSKPPSPTDGLTSPSKMIGRPWTPSLVTSSIPTSRAGTPNGAISPPNTTSNSQIPTKNTSLPSPNKTSHIPSRSSTPQSPPNVNNAPVTSLNKKLPRPRTGSWPANCSNIPARPNSPQPGIHPNTSIPSKLQYRRQVTC